MLDPVRIVHESQVVSRRMRFCGSQMTVETEPDMIMEEPTLFIPCTGSVTVWWATVQISKEPGLAPIRLPVFMAVRTEGFRNFFHALPWKPGALATLLLDKEGYAVPRAPFVALTRLRALPVSRDLARFEDQGLFPYLALQLLDYQRTQSMPMLRAWGAYLRWRNRQQL